MRSKARRALGKYFIPEGDARNKGLNRSLKNRSFHNARSFFEGLNERRKNRSQANRLPDSSIYDEQPSLYGGGKRKRRKTRRKSKRTKRRSRRTRR